MSYRSARRARYDEPRWPEYVPVAERRRRAALEMEKLRSKGQTVSPVVLESKKIATTFWGKAWCENLEGYADFASRIERGRSYVRNGSVVDLQISPNTVTAVVSGSSLYKIKIDIAGVPKPHWSTICRDCAGGIDSLVELLQGRFSTGVMERICRPADGLFPKPAEIKFKCSCPDWAYMCKHVAAVLYGVGARLDRQPELLFRLRAVDENALVAHIDAATPLAKTAPGAGKVLAGDDLPALFGLDMDGAEGGDALTAVASPAAQRSAKTPGKKLQTKQMPAKAGKAASNQTAAAKRGSATPPAQSGAKSPRPRAAATGKPIAPTTRGSSVANPATPKLRDTSVARPKPARRAAALKRDDAARRADSPAG